jgi:hypothetical protein
MYECVCVCVCARYFRTGCRAAGGVFGRPADTITQQHNIVKNNHGNK